MIFTNDFNINMNGDLLIKLKVVLLIGDVLAI